MIIFLQFSAHTMVLLGNSRLEEKIALEKVREYIAYQEYRKYRFILKKGTNHTNDKDNRNFETKTFTCKPCDYTTPSRSNWWRHKKTQKHKIMIPVMQQ